MSSSHTETFSEAESLFPLVVLFSAALVMGYQSAQNVLVGQFLVVELFGVVALALYILLRRKR